MTIYEKMKAAGVEIHDHCSDLYVPVNDITRPIVEAYKFKSNVTTFIDQVTGLLSYDIPFEFDPYWIERGVK